MPASRREEEFFALLRPEQGKLFRTAWAILGNEADARDAMQEATIRAFRAFGQLRGGAGAFGQWLRRIVVNQCTQILRTRNRVIPVEHPLELGQEPAVAFELPGEGNEVWDAVRSLDERYRVVVVLRFLADLQLDDIGLALGIPLGTVKSRLHAALKMLRARLEARPLAKGEAM